MESLATENSGIQFHLNQLIDVLEKTKESCSSNIIDASEIMTLAIKSGKKILLFGNGGSAMQAEHWATELVGKFYHVRKALPGIALTTSPAILTAVANDTDFSFIFSRQIEALSEEGDVAIGISTSGKSKNVIEGIKRANSLGLKTISLTGATGGELEKISNICIKIPSTDTPIIQEVHLSVGHYLCEEVEKNCE
jgi:D-sedoheptulose 7-phosphate isomerase